MKTIHLGNHTVKIYDSIKELSKSRDNELQKAGMMDEQVGSDMASVGKHYDTLFSLTNKLIGSVNNKERHEEIGDHANKILQELKNLMMNRYLILEKIDIKSFAFDSLIHSINGNLVTDFSDDAIIERSKKLESYGLKSSEINDILEEVKKNFIPNYKQISQLGTVID